MQSEKEGNLTPDDNTVASICASRAVLSAAGEVEEEGIGAAFPSGVVGAGLGGVVGGSMRARMALRFSRSASMLCCRTSSARSSGTHVPGGPRWRCEREAVRRMVPTARSRSGATSASFVLSPFAALRSARISSSCTPQCCCCWAKLQATIGIFENAKKRGEKKERKKVICRVMGEKGVGL